MIIEKSKPGDFDKDSTATPSLREWDQHSSLLATVIDEVRGTNQLLLMQMSQGKHKAKVIPVPRPSSIFQKLASKARMDARIRKHDSLVARLLGDRAKKKD